MEIKLTFKITFVSGEQTTQEITQTADPSKSFEGQAKFYIQQMLAQYAQVGMLRQPTPGSYMLLLPSQIAIVEVEMPSIVLADATEVRKVTLE